MYIICLFVYICICIFYLCPCVCVCARVFFNVQQCSSSKEQNPELKPPVTRSFNPSSV